MDIRKLYDDPRFFIGQHAEHAVVGPHKDMVIEFDAYKTFCHAAGTVDGHQMDGPFGEIIVNGPQGKGGMGNVIYLNMVGNVHDNQLRVNGKHFCFHSRYVIVGIPKIGDECY